MNDHDSKIERLPLIEQKRLLPKGRGNHEFFLNDSVSM